MSTAPSSNSSSTPAVIALPGTAPRLKATQVLEKIGEFEARLEVVERQLPEIEKANELLAQVKVLLRRTETQGKDIDSLKKENEQLRKEITARAIICDETTDEEISTDESDNEEKRAALTKMEEELEGSALAYADNAFKV